MNYYSFHIGDYRGATAHLSNDEDLCYRRLLDLYYDKDGGMPAINVIARRVRFSVEIVESILSEFFTETDLGWSHDRADREIRNFKKQTEGGKKGAEARWGGHRGAIAPPSDTHMGLDSPPNATPMPTNNHKPITNISPLPPKGVEEEKNQGEGVSPRIEKTGEKTSVRGGDIHGSQSSVLAVSSTRETLSGDRIDQRFSEFWKAYPENRRKNLYRAQSAFSASMHSLPTQEELMKSLEAFKASKEWRQDNGKFIPSPETWIAEHRWQDAPAFSTTAKPKPKSDIDEADAFRWRAETYPDSLEVHPGSLTFPTSKWPADIRREYLASKKTNQPQPQAT
jgi:uncharacterized protein YdaU (DUF1376 family)